VTIRLIIIVHIHCYGNTVIQLNKLLQVLLLLLFLTRPIHQCQLCPWTAGLTFIYIIEFALCLTVLRLWLLYLSDNYHSWCHKHGKTGQQTNGFVANRSAFLVIQFCMHLYIKTWRHFRISHHITIKPNVIKLAILL